ncbi:hypothetical protein QX249_08680 [Vibrio parahaemolyticus]|uniref:Uncharacterized protein n=1 Tax=Vibrio parahaemolyticus TaxID=670 RepID=A0AAW8PXQ8_VIBPH|nr:hypothetical protein [Vibrio parahaemolyticus]EGR2229335.1 hypothetical protein [Vibrio parahaemolyticus]MDS1820732.1 hypothetical protein [Vibrio parahaemolyticus]
MKNLYKLTLVALLSPVSAHALSESNNVFFEQPLGGEFDSGMPHQDFSNELPSGDGTITYLYKPKEELAIPFRDYAAYLTPISKKVAIVEASKLEDNLESCTASLRYFTREYADKTLQKFKSLEQLSALGYTVNQTANPNIEIRYSPEDQLSLQYGCTPSSIEKGKFAFIVSFSDGKLKSIAEKERDKILATKN